MTIGRAIPRKLTNRKESMIITVAGAARIAAMWMNEIQTASTSKLTKAAQKQRAELAKLERPYFIRTADGRRMIWGYYLTQRRTPFGKGLFEIVEIPIR